MIPLLEFTNELLYKIVDQVHPDDIVNFAFSCRHLYRLAGKALSLHVERRQYQNVVLDGCHRHTNNLHPLEFMETLCTDWRIGEYVKTLRVQCCEHPVEGSGEEEEQEDYPMYEDAMENDLHLCTAIMLRIKSFIQERIFESGVLTSGRHDMAMRSLHRDSNRKPNLCDVQYLCDSAVSGDRGAIVALLLFFVPNLKALHLTEFSWYTAPSLDRVILSMAEPNPRTRKPLMDLSQVHLEGAEGNWKGENFEALISFATLPSMRRISANFVEGRVDQMIDWKFPPHFSNVTEILLKHGQVKADFLKQLLIGVKQLKRFSYEHYDHDATEDSGRMMETQDIIETLLEHTKHSLEYLTLKGQHHRIKPCRTSIRGFKVLKEVVLESQVYVKCYGCIYYDPPPDSRQDFVRLVDVLPSSIESIKLVGWFVLNHALYLLPDLLEQKKTLLPKLKNLIICSIMGQPDAKWVEQLRRKCEKVGVTLVVGYQSRA
ncbi:hypothetical protein BDR22DRAFT_965246 [Usnea florida]